MQQKFGPSNIVDIMVDFTLIYCILMRFNKPRYLKMFSKQFQISKYRLGGERLEKKFFAKSIEWSNRPNTENLKKWLKISKFSRS